MLERFLCDQKRPENVCVEHSVKLLLGDFFQGHEFINAGVIDQEVDFAKGLCCFSEEPLDFRLLRNVRLYTDCFSAALRDFVHHAICIVFCGCVVNDH